MSVAGVGSSSYLGSQVGAVAGNSSMGKDEFLSLLVTQLSNQDPLNPMDNQQFASQLAQFSSLELLTNMQTSLDSNLEAQQSVAAALQGGMAADLVGRSITALDDRVLWRDGQAPVAWEVDGEVAQVVVELRDSSGALVRRETLDNPENATWNWNGRDGEGHEVAEGIYSVSLSATDAQGGELAIRPLWRGPVEAVRYRQGVPFLVSRGEEFTLGQVSEVATEEESTSRAATPAWSW
jgi:flagellar basal-body rod modification protein FlgD